MSGYTAAQVLQLVLDGLLKPDLFPVINLGACMPVSSLNSLQNSTPMKTLTAMYSEANLDPRVGYNQGSGDISVTIIMPRMELFTGNERYVHILFTYDSHY